MPERHVDDPDVPQAPVVDRPVDRLDDVARQPRAVRAHRTQADDVRAGSDVADDARDVRAVAVQVAFADADGRAGEVEAERHAAAQVRMPRVHARVDHGHPDAAAGEPTHPRERALPHLVGANRLGRHGRHRPHREVPGHAGDVGVRAQVAKLPAGHFEDGGIPQALLDARAVPRRQNLELLVAAAHDDVGRRLDARREPLAEITGHAGAALARFHGNQRGHERKRERQENNPPEDRDERTVCLGHGYRSPT